MKIIGITGNTGSGKSIVCETIEEIGGYIIDADELAHDAILRRNDAYNKITEIFGTDILSDDNGNEIDRKKLGGIVFGDNEKLDILTKIVHKQVICKSLEIIKAIQSAPDAYKLIAIDGPLLYEAGMDKICDAVILITAPKDVRLKRLFARDDIDEATAEKRDSSRKSADEYADRVDYTIKNDGCVDELKNKVTKCITEILAKR